MKDLPDFDTLMWMAKHRPEELNQLQSSMSEELINSAGGNQSQLRAVKEHLNRRLELCTNPYQRCITTVSMMRTKFGALADVLRDPEHFRSHRAEVIQLNRKTG
ncbi:DUF3135 domain-containing protein [Shewanella avicenniae]|uniref:DUF3135 domain-containing protein n=1 Tax=Shewanella avicenniae TaxID=2814294 RepID=A0ABX7QV07_9GAMM|nr:DUF3135 domain-containing protein [Shewanella avicenniae]QSX35104.1 DUF3135 domain-containing protein [Shewanella avicenniae]